MVRLYNIACESPHDSHAIFVLVPQVTFLLSENKKNEKIYNTRANSLKAFIKKRKDIHYGYKFADGNITALAHYMIVREFSYGKPG